MPKGLNDFPRSHKKRVAEPGLEFKNWTPSSMLFLLQNINFIRFLLNFTVDSVSHYIMYLIHLGCGQVW